MNRRVLLMRRCVLECSLLLPTHALTLRSPWRLLPTLSIVVWSAAGCVSDENRPSDIAPDTAPKSAAPDDKAAEEDAFALKLVRAGRALADQGDHADALAAYDEALAIAPNFALAHLEWGIAAQMVGRPSAEVAIALKQAVSLAPENPRAQFQRALFVESQGNLDEAIAGYRATLKLRNDHARARARLGALRLRQGDAKAALESLKIAVSLDPGPVPPRVTLAEAAEAVGDVDLAAKTLRSLVKEFPKVPTWRQRLIALYERNGDEAAAASARKALEALDPKKERALRPLKKRRTRRKRSR